MCGRTWRASEKKKKERSDCESFSLSVIHFDLLMQLPNSDKAVVPIEKLRDYSLNPTHNVGKHKARVFESALGITMNEAEWLKEKALKVALNAEAIRGKTSPFGQKYVIDARLEHLEKSAIVRFSWIIETGTDYPRLTSCYVK